MAISTRGAELARGLDDLLAETKQKAGTVSLRYALDPFAHCEDEHVWILDLETGEDVAFKPWPHQVELARAWIDLDLLARSAKAHPDQARVRWRNVVEEKTRQMGITWALAWLDLWALMYHDDSGLVTHLKYRKVDDGGSGSTTDSYFGKIRHMWLRLPENHRPPLEFTMGLVRHSQHPRRFLVAEGASPESGRGGNYSRGVIDEAARIQFGESVHAALSRAIPQGRVYNSTPNGDQNVYARLVARPPVGMTKLRHHWTQHPLYAAGLHIAAVADIDDDGTPQEQPEQLDADMERIQDGCALCEGNRDGLQWDPEQTLCHRYPGRFTSPWYDQAVAELTDDQVAMELEIDYSGRLSARVYPEFNEGVHVVDSLPLDPSAPVELAFDYGGHTAVLLLQNLPYEVHVVGEVEIEKDAIPEMVDRFIRAEFHRLGFHERELGRSHTLAFPAVGDPAGEQKQQATARSLVHDYRTLGWNITSRPRLIKVTILAGRRLMLGRPKRLYVSREGAPNFIEHAKQNHWPVDRDGNRKPNQREPNNDRHNHMMRAFAYWCAERFPPLEEPDDPDVSGEQRRLAEAARARRSDSVGYDMTF